MPVPRMTVLNATTASSNCINVRRLLSGWQNYTAIAGETFNGAQIGFMYASSNKRVTVPRASALLCRMRTRV
jgi:hypothetical protein